jgi:RimJ/RimL family protein N-acetyltransferase
MWSNPTVTRFIGGRPSSAEEAWSRLLRYIGLWPALGYGYWVITDRQTGRFVGEVGLADFHREIAPPITCPEAGWALLPCAHGQGFATEALEAVLSWADSNLFFRQTMCIISPDNTASIRVAEKTGYTKMHEADYKDALTGIYERKAGTRVLTPRN